MDRGKKIRNKKNHYETGIYNFTFHRGSYRYPRPDNNNTDQRRQINIESITASESAVKGVQLLTLVVKTTAEMIQKVARQMEKLVDVLKVFVHTSDQIIYQEIALYQGNNKGH